MIQFTRVLPAKVISTRIRELILLLLAEMSSL